MTTVVSSMRFQQELVNDGMKNSNMADGNVSLVYLREHFAVFFRFDKKEDDFI